MQQSKVALRAVDGRHACVSGDLTLGLRDTVKARQAKRLAYGTGRTVRQSCPG